MDLVKTFLDEHFRCLGIFLQIRRKDNCLDFPRGSEYQACDTLLDWRALFFAFYGTFFLSSVHTDTEFILTKSMDSTSLNVHFNEPMNNF